MRSLTVLVCGHVTLDRVDGALVPGGTAYYAGRAAAALGARVRVLSAAGLDFPRDALAGLDAELAPSAETTTFENVYGPRGERTQRILARAPPLDPGRLPAGWRGADVLLLGPVIGEVDVDALARAAAPRLVGLCVQGLARERAAGGEVIARPLDPAVPGLRRVDAAVLGGDEARADPGLPARLAATVPVVAYTRGVLGCEVLVRGRLRRVGVHPAAERDPTGAGDVFAAGFLVALARGEDPLDAARLGAAAASIAVEGRGGESLWRLGEAARRAERVPILG